MTGFAIILFLILAVGIVLAFELLKMSRAADRPADAVSLHRAVARLADYSPMQRLFREDDLREVQGRPELAVELRAHRKKAMRLYLRRLRRDFMNVWSACRLLAPVSSDPDFVANLMRNLVQFHALVAVLHVRCTLGYWASIDADLTRLTESLSGMRIQASSLLYSEAGAAGA